MGFMVWFFCSSQAGIAWTCNRLQFRPIHQYCLQASIAIPWYSSRQKMTYTIQTISSQITGLNNGFLKEVLGVVKIAKLVCVSGGHLVWSNGEGSPVQFWQLTRKRNLNWIGKFISWSVGQSHCVISLTAILFLSNYNYSYLLNKLKNKVLE